MSGLAHLDHLLALSTSRTGQVVSYDDAAGSGVLTEEGGASYPFHCSAIVDGTRQINPGAMVRFVLRAGNGGRLEADELIKGERGY